MNIELSVDHLSCHLNDRLIIQDLSFSLRSGELLQVVGENGSGKTTLLKALANFIPFDGLVTWHSSEENSIFYLGHRIGLRLELSAIENLQSDMGLKAHSFDEIEAILTKLQLWENAKRPCRYLSQGQRQRLALARLWLTQARCWILDEPFTALDSAMVVQLEERFQEHLLQQGSIVFTSHRPINLNALNPSILTLC